MKKILENSENKGGNSGSFFYFTPDKRFIIKSLNSEEKNVLIGPFLNEYVENLTHSLLSRIYGVFKIRIGKQYSVYLMIMGSIIPPDAKIRAVFDIKGSVKDRRSAKIGLRFETLDPT